ncbi:PREDICTED: uncharacterized protein PB18E9.04c-like isoform X2 [Rhagoletis zephyria]|uniref:uncharacterized protein PB18E9.04c-like isoform X2 n=1 Tax=Rhagoletis zephyria TaxID=28612 RepID=UPI0008113E10|nr:PREDICTED: uncharacterized protein PB18E9.04c-like isoform X2 [Rhagoletis zephyria]
MNSLVILATGLLCFLAVRVPYVAGDSSEEEYHVLLPPSDKGLLSLIGISSQPVIQAVKVKVPRYADPALKQQIIEQYLDARGLTPKVLAAAHNAAPATNTGDDDFNSRLEMFYNLGLGTQLPSPNLDINIGAQNAASTSNTGADGLNSRLESSYTLELTTQPPTSTPPPTVVIKSIAEPSTNLDDEPSTSTPPPTVVIKSIAEPSTNLDDEPSTSTPPPTVVIKSIAEPSTNLADEPSTSTPPPTIVIKSIAEPSTNLDDEPSTSTPPPTVVIKSIAEPSTNLDDEPSTSTPPPTVVIKSIAEPSTNLDDEPSTSTPPPIIVIKSIVEPSTNLVDEPLVTYDIVSARKRRQLLEISTTTSPIESTTVPDVIETSTMTDGQQAVEGITVMLDLSPPVSSTESPISTTVTTTQLEPFIPLIGFDVSILPASVSHVLYAPRIPIDSTTTTTSTDVPIVLAEQVVAVTTPHFPAQSRRIARAVSFNVMDQRKMTKATPVPPLPQTDVRSTKMSHLPRSSRKLRAVDEAAVAAPLAEKEGSTVVAEQEVTTQANNCDIGCTKFDFNPVCAFNGECYHQFPNQCIMDTFVCKRPDLGFKSTPRQRCAMHWLKRCKAEELKSE